MAINTNNDEKWTQEELHWVVESAPNAFVMADAEGRIVLVNARAENLFGYRREELIGQPVEMLVPEQFRAAHHEDRRHYMANPETRPMGVGRDLWGVRRDGSKVPVEIGLSPIQTDRGMLVLAAIVDISERKRAEQALREGNERLLAANRELDDFATIVSHDLKAPLRGVATLAGWMESDYADKLDAEGRENLAEMVNRVGRMDRMIEGILHYSRLGRTEEKSEPVPLDALVADVVHDLAPPARVRVRVAPRLPVVYGESVRLRQVFQNLIGNAIQYGDKAEIDVCLECADRGPFWQFSVSDNGPGIEERHFERIFKLFQTLAPSDTTDSTGVGLALVKRIVERAGGRVWVESRPGEGSTFHFAWPKGSQIPLGNDSAQAADEVGPSAPEPNSSAAELLPTGRQ